jgi:hypothetical protein
MCDWPHAEQTRPVIEKDVDVGQPRASLNARHGSARLGQFELWVTGKSHPIGRQIELPVVVAVMQQQDTISARYRNPNAQDVILSAFDGLHHPSKGLSSVKQDIVVGQKVLIIRRIDFQLQTSLKVFKALGRYYERRSWFIRSASAFGDAQIRV